MFEMTEVHRRSGDINRSWSHTGMQGYEDKGERITGPTVFREA